MSEHVHYDCKCNEPYCQFCDGGLFACTVCRGFEGSLPTDCPGAKMTQQQEEDVYAGKLDYRDGRGWVKPDGTGTSMGDIDVKNRSTEMIVRAKEKLFLTCPSCHKGEWRADQIKVGQVAGSWACPECHQYFNVARKTLNGFDLTPTGEVETPVTVTLKSVTEPPIFLTLNAWKYAHSQKDSQEQYVEHQRYFYDEHTCPTNYLSLVERISFNGDNDPHGVFEFVSVVDGHYKDPNVIE